MQRRDDPDNRSITSDSGTHANDALTRLSGTVILDACAAFDRIAGQRALEQFGKSAPTERIVLIMAASRERCDGEVKRADPAGIGRDVAQLVVEYRDTQGDLVDEMPHPVRWESFGLAASARYHDSGNFLGGCAFILLPIKKA